MIPMSLPPCFWSYIAYWQRFSNDYSQHQQPLTPD